MKGKTGNTEWEIKAGQDGYYLTTVTKITAIEACAVIEHAQKEAIRAEHGRMVRQWHEEEAARGLL